MSNNADPGSARILGAREIREYQPDPPTGGRDAAMASSRQAMMDTGCWQPGQQMGERWAVGCVLSRQAPTAQ